MNVLAALFINSKSWNWARCPATGEWIKCYCIYHYYLVVKTNELASHQERNHKYIEEKNQGKLREHVASFAQWKQPVWESSSPYGPGSLTFQRRPARRESWDTDAWAGPGREGRTQERGVGGRKALWMTPWWWVLGVAQSNPTELHRSAELFLSLSVSSPVVQATGRGAYGHAVPPRKLTSKSVLKE